MQDTLRKTGTSTLRHRWPGRCRTVLLAGAFAVAAAGCGASTAGTGAKASPTSGRSATSTGSSASGAPSSSSSGSSSDSGSQTYPDGWPSALTVPEGAEITSHLTLHGAAGKDTVQLMVTAKITGTPAADVYDTMKSKVTDAGYKIEQDSTTTPAGLFYGRLGAVKPDDDQQTCSLTVTALQDHVNIKITVGQ